MRNAVATSAVLLAVALLGSGHFISDAQAASLIPYPSAGTPNADNYTFTATDTGNISLLSLARMQVTPTLFVLLVNGIPTGIIGLNNHTSNIGDRVVFGSVNAGDTLTFLLIDANTSSTWYSNRDLNTKQQHPTHLLHALRRRYAPVGSPSRNSLLGLRTWAFAQGGDFVTTTIVFLLFSRTCRSASEQVRNVPWRCLSLLADLVCSACSTKKKKNQNPLGREVQWCLLTLPRSVHPARRLGRVGRLIGAAALADLSPKVTSDCGLRRTLVILPRR